MLIESIRLHDKFMKVNFTARPKLSEKKYATNVMGISMESASGESAIHFSLTYINFN